MANSQRLQHVGGAEAGDLPRQQRLLPGRRNEALRGEVIDLIRPDILHDSDQAGQVGQVAVHELHLIADAQPIQPLAHHIRGRGAAHQSDYTVAFFEQQLGQICSILASDTGNEAS